MIGADWSNLTVAGAFVAGFVVATITVVRIVRSVVRVLDRPSDRRAGTAPRRHIDDTDP